MATPRKTFRVEDLKSKINSALEKSDDDYVQGRLSMCQVLTDILLETNNYNGFSYLEGTGYDYETMCVVDESRRKYK